MVFIFICNRLGRKCTNLEMGVQNAVLHTHTHRGNKHAGNKERVAKCNRGFLIRATGSFEEQEFKSCSASIFSSIFYPILTKVFILVVLFVHLSPCFKYGFSKPTKPRCFYFEIPHPFPSFQQWERNNWRRAAKRRAETSPGAASSSAALNSRSCRSCTHTERSPPLPHCGWHRHQVSRMVERILLFLIHAARSVSGPSIGASERFQPVRPHCCRIGGPMMDLCAAEGDKKRGNIYL